MVVQFSKQRNVLYFILILVSSCLGFSSPAQTDVSAKVLLGGAATANITPPLDEPIVGNFGQPRAVHVHDELLVRSIVLDNGQVRVVLVVCDNIGLPREVCDAAKEEIAAKTKIPFAHVMISSTHTHSSISARGKNKVTPNETFSAYQRFVIRKIVEAVRCAVNNLEPARIGWGVGRESRLVFNRRWYMKPGKGHMRNPFGGVDQVRMWPPPGHGDLIKPAGPTDPEVSFLSVQSLDGRPIALMANYSLHYAAGVKHGHISADYFGVFAGRIQQLLDADRLQPPFVGIMSNGTSGDINGVDYRTGFKRLPPYEKIQQVGEFTAQAVFKAHQNIKFHDWVPLDVGWREITLAVRKPTPSQLAYAARVLAKPRDADSYHRHEKEYAKRVQSIADSPDHVMAVLQTLRMGDLGIATIPFEVFVEIGLELKAKSPLAQTFTISFGNGCYGYLPTEKHHELGGYETWLGTNFVEKTAATKIVQTLLTMFSEL